MEKNIFQSKTNHLFLRNSKKKNELVEVCEVFDFDGTLYVTPRPNEKTGQKWTDQSGWWGNKKSLSGAMLDLVSQKKFVQYRYKKSKKQSANLSGKFHTIIMTGRHLDLKEEVLSILRNDDNLPEVLIMKPNDWGKETIDYKILEFKMMIERFPKLRHLEIWDDRLNHIKIFENLGLELMKNNPGLRVIVHDVLLEGRQRYEKRKREQMERESGRNRTKDPRPLKKRKI